MRNQRDIRARSLIRHGGHNNKYKVELREVRVVKKALQVETGKPPRGYRFVAPGAEAFTSYCKEQCRKRNAKIYLKVADSKGKGPPVRPDRVFFHVTRAGYYFPVMVVEAACRVLAHTISLEGIAKPRSMARHKDEEPELPVLMRELFPHMPEGIAQSIIDRAFRVGRVGDAKDKPLLERLQLAVSAHIRHVYTNYEQLLKIMPKPEARGIISPSCIKILKEWRGENGETEITQGFEEWIDLVSDDDEDDELQDRKLKAEDREHHQEIYFELRGTPHDYQVVAAGDSIQHQGRNTSYLYGRLPMRHSVPDVVPSIEVPRSNMDTYSVAPVTGWRIPSGFVEDSNGVLVERDPDSPQQRRRRYPKVHRAVPPARCPLVYEMTPVRPPVFPPGVDQRNAFGMIPRGYSRPLLYIPPS
ncbi:hypothetical protein EJ06DRAFT_226232 [Trichodelitschia bisporula]|uniref:DUF2293 domain-containing protein n=1 Tax=Trichodelitschia bisporula TaxID=703511 RepID=A0A6G1HL59_9PEZI|nr:hypothetical protein EJ06DRAFT_226232 [Trichodelitschia bisporula]